MRWPLQPLQPFQQTQLQPPFGQSVDSLCHPWFTTTNVSYRFPILKLPPPPRAVLLVIIHNLVCPAEVRASKDPKLPSFRPDWVGHGKSIRSGWQVTSLQWLKLGAFFQPFSFHAFTRRFTWMEPRDFSLQQVKSHPELTELKARFCPTWCGISPLRWMFFLFSSWWKLKKLRCSGVLKVLLFRHVQTRSPETEAEAGWECCRDKINDCRGCIQHV